MTSLALKKSLSPSTAPQTAYEPTFLESLSPALPHIAKHGIKVAVNAGGCDTKALFDVVVDMVRERGLGGTLSVGWVEGDDVLDVVKSKLKDGGKGKWERIRNAPMPGRDGLSIHDMWMEGGDVKDTIKAVLAKEREKGKGNEEFENLHTGEKLQDWEFKDEILAAQAYLGGMGIARAFGEGSDIVVCGRVSDASPVIGAAAWWHGWDETNLQELARAFVAGHLVECSTYVSGGNFSGFKDHEGKGWLDVGFPIAEIGRRGEVVITKQKNTGGEVSTETCKAQLLYEIQGPWYFNSDVTAILDEIEFVQIGTNRVSVRGVRSAPPPPTTKVGITARGGYQAEVHWFLVGLDIQEKARMLEMQIRHALGDTSRFHVLRFSLNGTCPDDPTDQNSATVDFRVFAQARNEKDIAPNRFLRPIIDLIMSAYPGATFHLDFRQGMPKPVQEYFVTLLPQKDLKHVVHLQNGRNLEIAAPSITKTYAKRQPSQDVSAVVARDFGETIRGPLGWIVHVLNPFKTYNAVLTSNPGSLWRQGLECECRILGQTFG
jgi:hypothetical protein